MTDQILIITQAGDAHIDFVKKYSNLPTLEIDPANISNGTELSYEFNNGKMLITYDNKPLDNIRSVWYRKPKPIWADVLPVPDEYKRYSETSMVAHLREIYVQFQDAFWMSD